MTIESEKFKYGVAYQPYDQIGGADTYNLTYFTESLVIAKDYYETLVKLGNCSEICLFTILNRYADEYTKELEEELYD
ncbi:MAG: hypothetical protein Q8P20_01040 [bacterium]|nr:hypothetical protein [bacterium]